MNAIYMLHAVFALKHWTILCCRHKQCQISNNAPSAIQKMPTICSVCTLHKV